MPKQETMRLIVTLDGATQEEVQKAGEAAMAVFAQAGVTPYDAAAAAFAREGWDLSEFDPEYDGYDGDDAAISDLWFKAAARAAEVGCAAWPVDKRLSAAVLEITC
jgi:hypothetical protein